MENNEIQGSLSVSQGAVIGGDVQVRGTSVFGHNVKIKGWLDAKNIKGPLKGLFKDELSLKEAYPEPQPGWFALVGNSLPANVYIEEDGEWVATGEQGGEVFLSLDGIEEDITDLQELLASGVLVEGSLSVSSDETTATMTYRLKKIDGTTQDYTLSLPIASDTVAGLMTPADKKLLLNQISIDDIDMDFETMLKPIALGQMPSRFIVVSTLGSALSSRGVLDVFSDSIKHQVTQVYTTHDIWDSEGKNFDAHQDETIYTYFRSYHVSGGTSTIPVGTWGEWQLISTSDTYNNIQTLKAQIADLDKEVYPLNVTLSVNPTIVEAGASASVTVNWSATLKEESINDAASFTLNGTSVSGTTSKTETITDTTPGTKTYTLVTSHSGRSNTSKVNLSIVGAMYFGFNAANAVGSLDVASLGKQSLKTSPGGIYTLQNGANGNYMWLCVPDNMTINKVTLNGFDVPMEAYSTKDINNIEYKCYRCSNSLIKGNYTIAIT